MRHTSIAQFFLTPFSWLYYWGVCLRHLLYDLKLLKKKFAPLPVVSIGNVVAGGAGKTQAALLLAEELANEVRVAILSRGYRSIAEHAKEPLLVKVDKHSAGLCGDEPWMLASRLCSAAVIVNKNRFKSALVAEKLGIRLLILDDGMQHRKLHRDFEIIVIDGKNDFGHFLPKGNLREDPTRLKKADLILFVGYPNEQVIKKVAALTSAPQVIAKIAGAGLFKLDGLPIDTLQEKSVGVFCGIANPGRFVQTVKELGAHIVATHFSSDHKIMEKKELQKFAADAHAKGASLLVCTEKDKVKLDLPMDESLSLPIGWIKTTLQIVQNQCAWKKTVNEIKLLAGIL